MDIVLPIFIFVFGSLIGSFLNVLILRLPKEEDWVVKRSYCPNCKTIIPWYFNIPVLGFLLLKGKCHTCQQKISYQYITIELLVGSVSLLLYFLLKSGLISDTYMASFYFSCFCMFLVHAIVDLRHRILPNIINYSLGILFLTHSFFYQNWTNSLVGFLIGLLFPLAVTYIFYKLRGVVGLGGGDIKLYAVLGIFLGPMGIVMTIFLSCFLGALIGLILIAIKRMKKENPIPFGPFIILVASIQIFFPFYFTKIANLLILF